MSRLRVLATTLAALAIVTVASCALDLDEGLLDRSDSGPVDTDSGSMDAGVEDAPSDAPSVGTCTRDEECTSTHGCLAGRCDLVRGVCVFDVCKTPACNSAACDKTTQQCGAPVPYRYRAGSFAVGGTVSRVVAVHPWLVMLTAAGPLAFDVSNPATTTAVPIPITGLGFYPTRLVVSGNRVYFLAENAGNPTGPTRLPIAYIDMPANPFADKLEAKSVLANYNRPPEGYSVFSSGNDSVVLVGPGGPESHPSSRVEAPLTEPVAINATPIVFTPGSVPVAVSGSRLVMRQFGAPGIVTFGFVDGIGTATPAAQANFQLADAGFVSPPEHLEQTSSGAVFWLLNTLTGPLNVGTSRVRAIRGYFLLADGTSAFDPNAGVDIETYMPTFVPASALPGPTALLDPKSAIVTAAAPENPAQTSVQFARKEPLELVMTTAGARKRTVLPFPPVTIAGVAASNGIGYVVANDVPQNATVYIFDPGCDP